MPQYAALGIYFLVLFDVLERKHSRRQARIGSLKAHESGKVVGTSGILLYILHSCGVSVWGECGCMCGVIPSLAPEEYSGAIGHTKRLG